MEKMVEVEPATQDELRQDLKSLFQGAIRLTLEMVLEEELKAMVASATIRAGRSRKGQQERDVSEAPAYEPGSDRRDGPAQPGRRLARHVMGRYQRRSEEVDR